MQTNMDDTKREVVAPVYVSMYYEHQYDRMAKLEDQRLSITNIVITLSIVAVTFGFSNLQNVTLIHGLGLPILMIISNVFAIIYIIRSADWIELHRKRAKRVLETYAPDICKLIDEPMRWPHGRGKLWIWLFARWKIQLGIHILLIMLAVLIPIYIYLIM